jgi:hypothetical protein
MPSHRWRLRYSKTRENSGRENLGPVLLISYFSTQCHSQEKDLAKAHSDPTFTASGNHGLIRFANPTPTLIQSNGFLCIPMVLSIPLEVASISVLQIFSLPTHIPQDNVIPVSLMMALVSDVLCQLDCVQKGQCASNKQRLLGLFCTSVLCHENIQTQVRKRPSSESQNEKM